MHQPNSTTGTGSIYVNPSRILSLDVLRGIALLGLLLISVREFGGFTNNQQLFYITGTHGWNFKLMAAINILLDGKMLALFALVFGAGMLLYVHTKKFPVAITPADAFIRKQMWLMGFGLVNAILLLWPSDILFSFGMAGILLFAFTRMKAKGLFILAIVCTLVYCGKLYWNYTDDQKVHNKWKEVTLVEKKIKADSALGKKDTLTKKQTEDKERWEGMVKSFKYDSAATASEKKEMGKNWPKVFSHLLPVTQRRESVWFYRTGVWEISAMVFLGMALFSIGFFTARFKMTSYLLVGLLFTLVGFALAWWRIKANGARIIDYNDYIDHHPLPYNIFFPFERGLMALGYASIVMAFLGSSLLQWKWKLFAVVGQMALTNYILQTIICTLFFYGYGFGNFGHLNQWQLLFFVAEVVLVQVVFSVFWLRYYYMGPLEWLLRCLVYRKRLPNRKPITAEQNPS